VEGGQFAGDPGRGGGLVPGDWRGLGADEPVQPLARLVGQQSDRRHRLPAPVGFHAAGLIPRDLDEIDMFPGKAYRASTY
jgi:hypothetical protein